MTELNKSNVIFDEHVHTYNNGEYTGITTILEEMGVKTPYPQIPAVMAAAQRGTEIHFQFKAWLDLGILPTHPWLDKLEVNYLKPNETVSEYLVSNDDYKVATEIDIIEVNKDSTNNTTSFTICDIKTAKNLDEQACIWQLSIGRWLFAKQNPQLQDIELNNYGTIYHIRENFYERKTYELFSFETVERFLQTWKNKGVWINEDNMPLFNDQDNVLNKMEKLIRLSKKIDKDLSLYKEALIMQMEERNKDEVETDTMVIKYIKGTTKKTLNQTKLFAEHPEINKDDFMKISSVKPIIKIDLK
jgi:hypothetical protein